MAITRITKLCPVGDPRHIQRRFELHRERQPQRVGHAAVDDADALDGGLHDHFGRELHSGRDHVHVDERLAPEAAHAAVAVGNVGGKIVVDLDYMEEHYNEFKESNLEPDLSPARINPGGTGGGIECPDVDDLHAGFPHAGRGIVVRIE